MPILAKIQFADDGADFALVAITATDAVAFKFDSGKLIEFRRAGVFPLHQGLETQLDAEVARLAVGNAVDEQHSPELVHVMRQVFGILRLPTATVRATIDRDRISAETLRRRYLEPWLATGDPTFPAEGANLPDPSAFIHARQHVTGAWAQTRIERDDRRWSVESGDSRDRIARRGDAPSLHAATNLADAQAHPGCDGGGCGDWVWRARNIDEWQRLGLA